MSVTYLEITAGPDAGARQPVDGGITIGRGRDADLQLTDPAVSRRHAAVRVEGRTLVVEDLESANGTWVNGDPVEDPRRVAAGDEIAVGGSRLRVDVQTGERPLTDVDPATPDEPTVIEPLPPS